MAKPKPQAEPNNKTDPVEDGPIAEDELQVDAADIELSEEAAQLVHNLQYQIDEAVAARQRALADFRNYQKRAAENEIHANKAGSARIARSLLSVVDQFDMALDQDTQQLTVEQLLSGISPRGSLALAQAARATAVMKGRDYCVPEDVVSNVLPVCAHRIISKTYMHAGDTMTTRRIMQQVLETVPSPA